MNKFCISVEIETTDGKNFTLYLHGDLLFDLKYHAVPCAIKDLCKKENLSGVLSIHFNVEKDGSYYDHDFGEYDIDKNEFTVE